MRKRLALAAALVVFGVTAVALATTPGENGRIAFRRYANPQQTSGAVFTVTADGTDIRRVTRPPLRTVDDQPDWAPDGLRLTFSRCPQDEVCRVHIVNADGTGLRPLTPRCAGTPGPGGLPRGCEDTANASFAPDGQHVTFTRSTGRERHFPRFGWDQIEHSAVAIIGADGRGEREILRLPRFAGDANFPQISPNGRLIIFERANSPLSRPRLGRALFVMNLDGSGLHRVTPWKLHAGDNPDWAPDSSRILFHSNVDVRTENRGQYYTVRPDGSGLTQLTHFRPSAGRRPLSASFSPDGRQIVFGRTNTKGLGDLWIMNADGSAERPLLRAAPSDGGPDWGTAR
jgi:Tol biopolymer transport system component